MARAGAARAGADPRERRLGLRPGRASRRRWTCIADALAAFRDRRGRHPVMTLGVVLAGPDTDRMRADGCRTYHRVTLADPRLAPVRDAMSRGAARGVFSLQLHGMEHFWPECLMRGAAASEPVRDWLDRPRISLHRGAARPAAEPLDRRDRVCPPQPLPVAQVVAAAGEESRHLRRHVRRATGGRRAADVRLDAGRRGGVGTRRRPRRGDARKSLREPRPGRPARCPAQRELPQRRDGPARRDRTSCATATSSRRSGIRISARCRHWRTIRVSAAPRCSRSIG